MNRRQRMFSKGYMGNCYASSEALYHILGGRKTGWKPMYVRGHWFIKHTSGLIVDPSRKQFDKRFKIPYDEAIGKGFSTKKPSKRAKNLIEKLTWRER